MPEPIVLEYVTASGAKHYFIGASEEAIREDVNTNFGFLNFGEPGQVPLKTAEGLGFYRQGYNAVKKSGCKSFKLSGLAELVESA